MKITWLLENFNSTLLKKETVAQVLSNEFCKITKNAFSYKTPPVAALSNLDSRLD